MPLALTFPIPNKIYLYLGIEPLHFYICVAAVALPIGPKWEGKRYPALRCIEIHAGGLDTLPACVLL